MSPCAICYGMSPCFKCQLRHLKEENEQLKNKLHFFTRETNKLLKLKRDYTNEFLLGHEYLPIVFSYSDLRHYRFLTITFDPKKFGQYNDNSLERNYIFKTIRKAIDDQLIEQVTGCFEYQKNGTTHAHMIISTQRADDVIEDFFRPYYTDDKRNKYAIKCLPAKFPNVENYIKKESNEFYRYDPIADYGVNDEPPIQPVKQETPRETQSDIDKRIKVYMAEISYYQKLVSTLQKRNISPLGTNSN